LGREALDEWPADGWSIYTADPEKLSLRATLPRFLEMESEHRSIILGCGARTQARQQRNNAYERRALQSLSFIRKRNPDVVDALAERIAGSQLPSANSRPAHIR